MKFDKAIPILYSKEVSKSLNYFIEHLKFEYKWEWEGPPHLAVFIGTMLKYFFVKTYNESQPLGLV